MIRRLGRGFFILLGIAAAALIAIAVNYRPGKVLGQRVDPGPIASVDGRPVTLSAYSGRVVLIAFGANG